MADSALGVTVSADVTDLRTKLALASASAKDHAAELRKMASEAAGASEEMQASMMPALSKLANEAAEAKAQVAALNRQLSKKPEGEGGLLGVFDALKGRFASMASMGGEIKEFAEAFMAAFAVEKIAEWVDEITEAGAKVEHLSQMLGMPADEISKLGFAAKASGLDIDQAATMIERLERASVQAAGGTGKQAAAFADLGISASQVQAHLNDANGMLNLVADAFARTADGPAKTAIAMELLGRAGAQMIPILNQGSAGLQEFADRAERTGSVITGPMAEGMEATAQNTAEMKAAFAGVALTLYEDFKPAIDATISGVTDLIEGFNDWIKSTSAGHYVMTALVVVVDQVIVSVETYSFLLKEAYLVSAGTFAGIADDAKALGVVLEDVFEGKWGQITHDWKTSTAQMAADAQANFAEMAKAAAEYGASVRSLYSNIGWGGVDSSGGKEKEGEKKQALDASNLEQGGGGSKSEVSAWQQQLTQKLLAEQKFGQAAKAEELSFWEQKLALVRGNGAQEVAERGEIAEKIYALESEMHSKEAAAAKEAANKAREAAKKAAEERAQIARGELQTTIEITKADIDARIQSLNEEVAEHKITVAQKIADEEQFTAQKLALDLQAVQSEIDAGNLSIVQLAAEYDKKRVLTAAYWRDIAKMQAEAANDQEKLSAKSTADMVKTIQPIGESFKSMFEGILEHHETFRAAMAKLELSLFNDLIGYAEKALVKWVATELAKTAASVSGNAARTGAAAAGAAAQSSIQSVSVLKDAKQAAAGAYASVSAIPIIGPILAPVAAATAFTAVEAFSAYGGMERVPYDNAPALLHQNEMVLPASIANPMREVFGGGGHALGGSGQSGGDLHIHGGVHVHGADGKSPTMDDIMKELKNKVRNGAFRVAS